MYVAKISGSFSGTDTFPKFNPRIAGLYVANKYVRIVFFIPKISWGIFLVEFAEKPSVQNSQTQFSNEFPSVCLSVRMFV